jgi:hypothetical protein
VVAKILPLVYSSCISLNILDGTCNFRFASSSSIISAIIALVFILTNSTVIIAFA